MPELPLRYSGIILSSALYSACTAPSHELAVAPPTGPAMHLVPKTSARISRRYFGPWSGGFEASWRPPHQGTVVSTGRLAWQRTGE